MTFVPPQIIPPPIEALLMATTAAARPAKTTHPKAKKDETFTFERPVYVWNITEDPENDRPYTVITAPLRHILKLVYVRPYDYEKSAGWQRDVTESHIAGLSSSMEKNAFSPDPWKAGVEEWHEQRLKFVDPETPDDEPHVRVTVSAANQLPLTDANHRRHALLRLLKRAEEIEDQAWVERILRQPITMQISLAAKYLVQDFLNYQKGKAVSKSLIKSMEVAAGDYAVDRLPIVRHATEAVKILAKDERGHLGNFVTFDKEAASKVQYASMIADNSSSLATTIYGGSLIALHYEKPPEWLAEKQIESYRAIQELTDPEEEGVPHSPRRILGEGYALSPVSKGGTRYGSHMLVMIGNMFAWRQAALGMDEPIDEEMFRVAEVASKVFDKKLEGADVQTKRRETAAFWRAYFSDMTRKEKPLLRRDGTPFEKVDGCPVELVEILSPSTLGVDKTKWKAYKDSKDGKVPPRTRARAKTKTEPEAE